MHESKLKFRGKVLKLQLQGSGWLTIVLAAIILVVPYVLTFTIIVSVLVDLILKRVGRKGIFRKENKDEFNVALNATAFEKKKTPRGVF